MTETRARCIYNAILVKGNLTYDQMIIVRKGFSYAWELIGGTPGGNFPSVMAIWKMVKKANCADKVRSVLPERIPTVKQLKAAFTREWDPSGPTTFVEHMQRTIFGHEMY